MILSVKTNKSRNRKLSDKVLIENQPDGTVKATLLSLPNYQTLGATKEEALDNLIQLFQERKPEIVTLEIEPPKTENPWLKIAGKYKDDPQFYKMLEYIEEYRSELDVNNESR
jgi:predicted RNase H-like HicB family nuclease